jgi:hypothetical protein
MTTSIIDRPRPDIIALEPAPETTPAQAETLPAHDLRTLGLESAARSLGMRVADLGPLQVRRAQADLVHCPICPGHQVRASFVVGLVPAA